MNIFVYWRRTTKDAYPTVTSLWLAISWRYLRQAKNIICEKSFKGTSFKSKSCQLFEVSDIMNFKFPGTRRDEVDKKLLQGLSFLLYLHLFCTCNVYLPCHRHRSCPGLFISWHNAGVYINLYKNIQLFKYQVLHTYSN